MTDVILGALVVALLLSVVRLVRGPSLPDRVVAFDLATTLAVGIMAVYAIRSDDAEFLPAAMVLALIAFIGTVAFARYLEHQGPPA